MQSEDQVEQQPSSDVDEDPTRIVNTSVKLPAVLLDDLDRAADERGLGRSVLIEKILRHGLNVLKPVAKSDLFE